MHPSYRDRSPLVASHVRNSGVLQRRRPKLVVARAVGELRNVDVGCEFGRRVRVVPSDRPRDVQGAEPVRGLAAFEAERERSGWSDGRNWNPRPCIPRHVRSSCILLL